MDVFTYLTPITYWLLIAIWLYILCFYIFRIYSEKVQGKLLSLLIIILAIDAFRTLFESVYFGAWYTSLAGLLPKPVHTFLVRPELVFIPKIINLIAAVIILVLLIWKWLPAEESESIALKKLIKKQIKKIKESEEKYLDLYHNAPDMYVSVDANTAMVVECNNTVCEKLGLMREEVIGQPVFNLYHSDSIQPAQEAFEEFVQTGEVKNREMRLKHKDDQTLDVSLNVSAVVDEDGKIIRSRSSFRDISELQKTSTALQKSESRLKEAQSIANFGNFEHDFTNDTIFWSDQTYTILGFEVAETPPNYETFIQGLSADDTNKLNHLVERAEEYGEDYTFVYDYQTRAGDLKHVEVVAHVVFDDDNRPSGLKGTVHDVTERRKIEKQLEDYSENLEELVKSQTDELKQMQKDALAKEKLATVGKLAGSVAHDIRNPLGAISNSIYFLKAIKKDLQDDRFNKHVDIMSTEIERVNEIISDLLNISKDLQPQFARLDIHSILDTVLDEITCPDHVEIIKRYDPEIPQIDLDSRQMERAIGNLVINAFQAIPVRGTLTLETSLQDNTICLAISDDGEGIKAENLDAIFEPLFTTKAKGVGLGLSIVKTFVERNRGELQVSSIFGEGTTFTITFPIPE